MRKTNLLYLLPCLFFFSWATAPVTAQEFADPLAHTLNDFLPTYTPFTAPQPPDRYFPDAVGKKVAHAITDAYLQNFAAVERQVQELSQYDATLTARGEPETGVTPHVRALLPQARAAQDPLETELLNATPEELLAEADRLLADAKRTRLGRQFNWLLATFDVGSLLFGTPRGPRPEATQGIFSEWSDSNGPSPRERKALVLYKEFLRRVPAHPRAAEVQKQVAALETRRNRALLETELARAEAALQQQDYWSANFHYHLALLIDETSPAARAGLARVEASVRQKEATPPPQDPLANLRAAQWEHDKETLKYILPGSGFVKDNFIVAGTQVATEGLVGAATFGVLTLVQTSAKLFHVLTGNPVSRQRVIAEGEKYLRTTPPEERAPHVYEVLANAYEKEGQLDKAITYYQLAGKSEEVERVQERAGEALLQLAHQSQHHGQKESYLRTLLQHYPNTKAARQATSQLRALQLPENRGLRLSKAFLQENPDLVGPRGLALKPELFDGDANNVELSEEGITLLPGGELALRLQSDQGPRTKIYTVPQAAWEGFWLRFREKGYEQAAARGKRDLALLAQGAVATDLTLTSEREKNEQNGWRTLPYLSGSVGGSGVDVRGTLPKELLGTRVAFGSDQRSAYVGVEVPVPFLPVDFLLLGRHGTPSLYPHIRLPDQPLPDEELYR